MAENDNQKQRMYSDLDAQQPCFAEDEIDLLELIRPLWRQKVLIMSITILAVLAAVILALQMTPKYRIYTQLKPGVYRWDQNKAPVPYMKTSDLKSLLTSGVFSTYVNETGLGDKAPKINVSSDRRGDQLTAYFFSPDRKEGKSIMTGFIHFLNDPLRDANEKKRSGLQTQRLLLEKSIRKLQEDIKVAHLQKQKVELNIDQQKEKLKLVDLQSDRLKRAIERVNADVKMTEKEVTFLEERITVAEETRSSYEKSRQKIDENTTRIISLRDILLQKPPDDSLQLLLLASTIQQNIAYLNTIEQKIETARKEVISHHKAKADLIKKQEKYRLAIADLQDKIKLEIPKQKSDIQKAITELQMVVEKEIPSKIELLNQQIGGVNDKINTIAMLEVVEPPQASIKPEKPKKRKIVALAGIMGLFLAIILAYLRHFWIANKEKLS
jgi:uncharacterized protein involved in exopolysaccharide biosynthesis